MWEFHDLSIYGGMKKNQLSCMIDSPLASQLDYSIHLEGKAGHQRSDSETPF